MTTSTEVQQQAKRVLIVEDETMIRMLLEDMLGELGYNIVAQAGHIDEALDAAKNAAFDIAILDVKFQRPAERRSGGRTRRARRTVRVRDRIWRTRFARIAPRPPDPQEAVPDGRT